MQEYEAYRLADERLRRRLWYALWVLAFGSYAAFTWAMVGPAWSHDALPTAAKPNGWSYPFACCSGMDCREVRAGKDKTVVETDKGYVIKATGELIPFGDKRIKNSPDGEFHWCSHGGRDTGGTICLFVPPRSF